MEVKNLYSYIFADTLVSDVFLSEYLPLLDPAAVKIYIYMLYISKKGKSFSNICELSSIINVDKNIVEGSLKNLMEKGLLSYVDNSYIINDIKEKEMNRLYTRKENTKPSEIDELSASRKERNKTLDAINNMFFKGVMAPSWYTKIDIMYEKYKFDHDVMLQLFQQCHDNNALNPNYVNRVAQSWFDQGIKNNYDLERFFVTKEKLHETARHISRKLKFMRMLTDYETAYVDKWINEYKYTREIIEYALGKTTSTTKPSIKYVDSIITSWHKSGLKTLDEIKSAQDAPITARQKQKAFDERDYDEKDIEDLYLDPTSKRENNIEEQ